MLQKNSLIYILIKCSHRLMLLLFKRKIWMVKRVVEIYFMTYDERICKNDTILTRQIMPLSWLKICPSDIEGNAF